VKNSLCLPIHRGKRSVRLFISVYTGYINSVQTGKFLIPFLDLSVSSAITNLCASAQVQVYTLRMASSPKDRSENSEAIFIHRASHACKMVKCQCLIAKKKQPTNKKTPKHTAC